MAERRTPTSTLRNRRDRLAEAVYDEARQGHVKKMKQLKKEYDTASKLYEDRLMEEEKQRLEKEAKKAERKKKK